MIFIIHGFKDAHIDQEWSLVLTHSHIACIYGSKLSHKTVLIPPRKVINNKNTGLQKTFSSAFL